MDIGSDKKDRAKIAQGLSRLLANAPEALACTAHNLLED